MKDSITQEVCGQTIHVPVYEYSFNFNTGLRDMHGVETKAVDKIEDRVEAEMRKTMQEEIKKICLHCSEERMYDQQKNEYYCPVCES